MGWNTTRSSYFSLKGDAHGLVLFSSHSDKERKSVLAPSPVAQFWQQPLKGEVSVLLYQFARAAVTKDHKLTGWLNTREILVSQFGG